VFCGDANLRDIEINEIGGLPKGVVDCWEAMGSDPNTQYTWDMLNNKNLQMDSKPRCRFDRVFFKTSSSSNSNNVGWKVVSFSLVGTERIHEIALHPSDHFGILVEFDQQQ